MEFFNHSTKRSDGTAGFVSFELRNDESLAGRALSLKAPEKPTSRRSSGVRYKFGTTEGEKEWPSGSYATPDEALRFFDSVVGIQVGGTKPPAPTTLPLISSRRR